MTDSPASDSMWIEGIDQPPQLPRSGTPKGRGWVVTSYRSCVHELRDLRHHQVDQQVAPSPEDDQRHVSTQIVISMTHHEAA